MWRTPEKGAGKPCPDVLPMIGDIPRIDVLTEPFRRIVRDVKERGRDLDNIVDQYLTTVKPMHYLYVEPTRALADVVINSGMNDVAFDVVRSKIQLMLEEE
mgnify:CR=1 FL=1